MMSDVSMLSDDDQPLRVQSGPSKKNGTNGHVAANGNGRYDGSSSLSEDDDMPLVGRTIAHSMPLLMHRHFLTSSSPRPRAQSLNP